MKILKNFLSMKKKNKPIKTFEDFENAIEDLDFEERRSNTPLGEYCYFYVHFVIRGKKYYGGYKVYMHGVFFGHDWGDLDFLDRRSTHNKCRDKIIDCWEQAIIHGYKSVYDYYFNEEKIKERKKFEARGTDERQMRFEGKKLRMMSFWS